MYFKNSDRHDPALQIQSVSNACYCTLPPHEKKTDRHDKKKGRQVPSETRDGVFAHTVQNACLDFHLFKRRDLIPADIKVKLV
jgi:hypothetical protein